MWRERKSEKDRDRDREMKRGRGGREARFTETGVERKSGGERGEEEIGTR